MRLSHFIYSFQKMAWLTALFIAACLSALNTALAAPTVIDTDWTLANTARSLPLKIRVPDAADASSQATPVVIFSHGLGGSREGGKVWGEHWAANGYLVIHVQHPGSDESLWKTTGAGSPRERLMRGASAQQLIQRTQDIRGLIDEVFTRARMLDSPAWLRRADLSRIAMTGHSFGAITTMALAGERFPSNAPMLTDPLADPLADPRIAAFIAFSPISKGESSSWPERYGAMKAPFFTITGTLDGDVLGTGASPLARAQLFDAQPAGDKYRVVFEQGDHSVFNGGIAKEAQWMNWVTGTKQTATPLDTVPVIQKHVKTLTLKFLDAYLKNDASAKAWLASDAAQALGAAGVWTVK